MPTTARVARIHEYGPPEVLRFEDIVVGEPGDDEALIRNTVIGLNFVDVYYRRGSLPVPAFPAIIGDEAAGVVEAVGKNIEFGVEPACFSSRCSAARRVDAYALSAAALQFLDGLSRAAILGPLHITISHHALRERDVIKVFDKHRHAFARLEHRDRLDPAWPASDPFG